MKSIVNGLLLPSFTLSQQLLSHISIAITVDSEQSLHGGKYGDHVGGPQTPAWWVPENEEAERQDSLLNRLHVHLLVNWSCSL